MAHLKSARLTHITDIHCVQLTPNTMCKQAQLTLTTSVRHVATDTAIAHVVLLAQAQPDGQSILSCSYNTLVCAVQILATVAAKYRAVLCWRWGCALLLTLRCRVVPDCCGVLPQ